MNYKFLFPLIFCSFAFQANAATYKYYFSDDTVGNPQGSDTNDCSIERPCRSLKKAESVINSLPSTDTVILYFDRGDTWTWNSSAVSTQTRMFYVRPTNPVVHIDAYGSGDRPVFDGNVSDFKTVPEHNTQTGPLKWNRFFDIAREGCSISNIEIKRVYGNGIYLNNNVGSSDSFVLNNSLIHDFGSSGITVSFPNGVENCEIKYNTFHTGQQLMRFNKRGSGWGGAITLSANGAGNNSMCRDNHVHHNIIYDIFGEGIMAANSLVEYNVVGDTASFGIAVDPHDYNALNGTIRYNLVTFSDYNTSDYTGTPSVPGGSSPGAPHGIRVYDEVRGGDNSGADIRVYGNIVINRDVGLWFLNPEDPGNPFGSVKIYDNVIIDSRDSNYKFFHAKEVNSASFYNNSSIFYDRPNGIHIRQDATFPSPNWTIAGNHFWSPDGSPVVASGWQNNYDISDPKLKGEPLVNWIENTGATYYKDINPAVHLNPSPDSAIYALSPILSMDINDMIGINANPSVSLSAPAEFQMEVN